MPPTNNCSEVRWSRELVRVNSCYMAGPNASGRRPRSYWISCTYACLTCWPPICSVCPTQLLTCRPRRPGCRACRLSFPLPHLTAYARRWNCLNSPRSGAFTHGCQGRWTSWFALKSTRRSTWAANCYGRRRLLLGRRLFARGHGGVSGISRSSERRAQYRST